MARTMFLLPAPWGRASSSLRRKSSRPSNRRTRQSGARARAEGRVGGEPAGDQPDAERQLEQSTGDGADEPGARDADQLQQCAPGEARVADETPDSQEMRNEPGAEEQRAE